ncbi:hypothetical protein FSARC_12776 [Fusarium sarcochroum]|uniref:Uncharacterized protein n=1 Tax=Fusarium sarcochroum TaxID=1208366 RepID=A0A8H4WV42_9HYPO|nr:hypothetical protein FSARC_12776 [Fusarium sarcochroum]
MSEKLRVDSKLPLFKGEPGYMFDHGGQGNRLAFVVFVKGVKLVIVVLTIDALTAGRMLRTLPLQTVDQFPALSREARPFGRSQPIAFKEKSTPDTNKCGITPQHTRPKDANTGYLAIKIMDDKLPHPRAWIGVPSVGPFVNFGQASSLGVCFEWEISRSYANVKMTTEAAREHLWCYCYDHLPNSELDWSMGGRFVCRVVGLECYGMVSTGQGDLAKHLRSVKHRLSMELKVKMTAEAAREHLTGHFFDHLPFSEVNWWLPGRFVCRIVGMPCNGKVFSTKGIFEKHLHTAGHLRMGEPSHEARLAAESVSAAPVPSGTTPSPQQPPTSVAPAFEMADQVELMDIDEQPPAERAMTSTHSAIGNGHGRARRNTTHQASQIRTRRRNSGF